MSVLPDVLPKGLELVVCGTAAGAASAARREYYAGPGNRFWATLHEVGLTDRVLRSDEYPRLVEFRIGLTDVEKSQSGADSSLSFSPNSAMALRERIQEAAPAFLCFNGKRAAQIALGQQHVDYGLQAAPGWTPAVFVAPSTSGLATRWWDLSKWHELARRLADARS